MQPESRKWFRIAGVFIAAAFVFTLTFAVLENAAYKRCQMEPDPSAEYPASEYPMTGASGFHLEQGATGFTCVYDDGPVERLHLGWLNA